MCIWSSILLSSRKDLFPCPGIGLYCSDGFMQACTTNFVGAKSIWKGESRPGRGIGYWWCCCHWYQTPRLNMSPFPLRSPLCLPFLSGPPHSTHPTLACPWLWVTCAGAFPGSACSGDPGSTLLHVTFCDNYKTHCTTRTRGKSLYRAMFFWPWS